MKEGICPCDETLARAVEVRKEPHRFKTDTATFDYAEILGSYIQQYADVLEKELE